VNVELLRTINGWSGNGALDAVMKFAAQDLILLSFAVVAVLCARHLLARQIAPVGMVAAALVVAFGLGLVAAGLHPEARPFTTHPRLRQLIAHEPGQSFPSDHSTAAFALAFATVVFLSHRWGAVLVGAALLIGFSRVYGGVHYPGDILGSMIVAAIAVGGVAAFVHAVNAPSAVTATTSA
jgi:undecaprenyl-diphosphatase